MEKINLDSNHLHYNQDVQNVLKKKHEGVWKWNLFKQLKMGNEITTILK